MFQGWFIELAKVVEAEVNDTYWDKPLFYIQAIPGGDPACPDGDCAKYALDALAAADSWSNGTAWGDALYFDSTACVCVCVLGGGAWRFVSPSLFARPCSTAPIFQNLSGIECSSPSGSRYVIIA